MFPQNNTAVLVNDLKSNFARFLRHFVSIGKIGSQNRHYKRPAEQPDHLHHQSKNADNGGQTYKPTLIFQFLPY